MSYFLIAIILPLLIMTVVVFNIIYEERKSEVKEHLNNILTSRVTEINNFISEKRRDVKIMGESSHIAEMTQKLSKTFKRSALHSKDYKKLQQYYSPVLENYLNTYHYYNAFLISTEGDVVLTIKEKKYLGSNLINGPLKESDLAVSAIKAIKNLQTTLSDFSFYQPSQSPALFLSSPVYQQGILVGAITIQLYPSDLYQVITNTHNLGESGEFILAKSVQDKILIVAPLRHQSDAAFKKVVVDSKNQRPVSKALNGESGQGEFADYRHKEIFAAWQFLPSLQLGIAVKIEKKRSLNILYI